MIGEAVAAALKRDGLAIDWVRDGKAADHALQVEAFDLLLLDAGLTTTSSSRST